MYMFEFHTTGSKASRALSARNKFGRWIVGSPPTRLRFVEPLRRRLATQAARSPGDTVLPFIGFTMDS
jgi:hypothetical protein